MGLIRTLVYLILGALVWYAIRNYLRKQAMRNNGQQQTRKQVSARVVKCQQCSVHLPEAEAISFREQWFCSSAHMERWLEQHKN